jgi:RNA polymerase sigma factor (sigma-70 family)
MRTPLRVLFGAGVVGDLTDGELLERFLTRGEGAESAFEALVARHGPMVYSVCRHILGTSHDAEDAFQATFLLLVRRASAIRSRDSIGSWLYGVARRVSVRARHENTRRRAREQSAGAGVAQLVGKTPAAADERIAPLLDEIARLPERYRTPVLLCELGGQTHAEAARQLNWPIGTVSGRLSRARELLRSRIARRGAVGATGLLTMTFAPVPVSAALIESTARSATLLAAGRITTAGLPLGAAALARAVFKAASLTRLQVAAGLVLAAGIASGTAGLASRAPAPPVCDPPGAAAASASGTVTRSTGPAPESRRVTVRPLIVLGWHDDEITSLAFAPDGKTLASGSRDAVVKLWDVEARRERATLRGHSAPIVALSFSDDGGSIASADANRTLKVWDVMTGRERLSLNLLPPAREPDSPEAPAADAGPVRLSRRDPDPTQPKPDDCSGT